MAEVLESVLGEPTTKPRWLSLAGRPEPRRAYEALGIGDNARPHRAPRLARGSPADTCLRQRPSRSPQALAADKALGAAHAFGRDMLTDWIAEEGKGAAKSGAKARLASAQGLWDKATALFADAEEYNLDARQTLISVMDAIRRHAQTHLLPAEAR